MSVGVIARWPSQLAAANSRFYFEETNRNLDRLSKAEGKDGVAQRGAKLELRLAEQAQSGESDATGPGESE